MKHTISMYNVCELQQPWFLHIHMSADRLAEERKKKAMKMKLARTQHLHFQKIQIKKEEEIGDLSDCKCTF